MKKLLTITMITIVSTFATFAQNSKAEKEVLKLNSEIDEALVKRDIAFFERVYADDYVSYDMGGTVKNRAQVLEDMRKRFEDSTSKNSERTVKSDNVKVRTSGNLAVVTASWTDSWKNTKDTNVPTHTDRGYYTAVFEKRGGKWTLNQMWTNARLNSGEIVPSYGLGFGLTPYQGRRRIGHSGGGGTGFATAFTRFLDEKVTVIILSNADQEGFAISDMVNEIAFFFPSEII